MANLDTNNLQITEILRKTMQAIQEGKKEIFEISESTRKDYNGLKNELEEFREKVTVIINEVEVLEQQERLSRHILSTVSKNFSKHSESDIKNAYERANELQVKLLLKRQEEKDLIKRRRDLEIRLKKSMEVLSKSENLMSKVSVAFDFLSGDLENITDTIEDMNNRSLLGTKIIQAQEEERQRIARDIHDGPAQDLTNAIIKTEICQKLIDVDCERTKAEIKELKKILRMSIKNIRGIIYNLHPMALSDIGFIPTIERYLSDFQSDTNIVVDFIVLSQVEITSSAKNITLFRIVQESLNNIKKHSKATRVKVKIEMTNKNIYVLVDDNGIGMDLESKRDLNPMESGYGLLNMRERAELINGSFEIKSKKNVGTKIIVNIPNEV